MPGFKVNLTNYNFIIPKGKNIVVLANYRTGSTALCEILSKITGYPNLDEDFHFDVTNRQQFVQDKKPSIIKIMQDQHPPEYLIERVFGNAFIIGIYRRDFPAQVVSWIISKKTDKWHKRSGNDVMIPAKLTISPSEVLRYTPGMYQGYLEYLDCGPFMDVEVCYEDLLPDLNESGFEKMPKHDGYLDHINMVKSLLPAMKIPYDE
jgi:LPS sulfotransferase NodH